MILEKLLKRDYVSFPLYDRPDWYDLDYQGYLAEAAFYNQLIDRGLSSDEMYVELGAGSGRLLKYPLSRQVKCHAVEPNVRMMETLEAMVKSMSTDVQLSMEVAKAHDFKGVLNQTIGLVSFPFNGLLHIHSYEEMLAAFRHILHRLAPDGRFALDIMAPAWEAMSAEGLCWGRLDERHSPVAGEVLWTYDRCHFDPQTHIMHSMIRFIAENAEQGIELFYTQRMWTYQEVLTGLLGAGFVIEEVYGDVDFSAFDENSPRLLVVVAKK